MARAADGVEVAYGERYQSLVDQLEGQFSLFPGDLVREGADFEQEESWEIGPHYLLLTDAAGEVCLGWAKFEEEAKFWYLHWIWVAEDNRHKGLATRMLRYMEAAARYCAAQRSAPLLFRLHSQKTELYEKAGFEAMDGAFGKLVCSSAALGDAGGEFDVVAASRWCKNGREVLNFASPREHVRIVPPPPRPGREWRSKLGTRGSGESAPPAGTRNFRAHILRLPADP